MYLERVFREERGRIYLRKNNGGWKRFENILKDFQDEYIIKFKEEEVPGRREVCLGSYSYGTMSG